MNPLNTEAVEQRLHEALKQAWPYVNKPFVSDSAKREVGRFAETDDVKGQGVNMLFAVQTAWTFVHGSGNQALMDEMKALLRHEFDQKIMKETEEIEVFHWDIAALSDQGKYPDSNVQSVTRDLMFGDEKVLQAIASQPDYWAQEGLRLKKAASVATGDLDRAFDLTNHIDSDWTQGSAISDVQGRCRSTSVGDIMRKGDTFHMVSNVGFKEIPGEVAHALETLIEASQNLKAKSGLRP